MMSLPQIVAARRQAANDHADMVARNLHKLVPHPWLPSDVTCPEVQVTAADMDPIVDAWPLTEPYVDLTNRLVIGLYVRLGINDPEEIQNPVRQGDTCETWVPAWWHPIWPGA